MSKKKNKLEEMSQIDGKDETKPSTLDQVWGDTGISKYGTNNFEEYKLYLKTLNRTDIQAHAMAVGIMPTDNHEILITRLEREFQRHVNSYLAPKSKSKKNNKMSKEVQKILSEGR